jgi:hypothetical protein
MDSSKTQAIGPMTQGSHSVDPDAAWRLEAERKIRARFLPQIEGFNSQMTENFRKNPSLGAELAKEHARYMAHVQCMIDGELKDIVDKERVERLLATGNEADPIKAASWMMEQRVLFDGYSKGHESQELEEIRREDVDGSEYGTLGEDMASRESGESSDEDEDAVVPEYRATWGPLRDNRFQRTTTRPNTPGLSRSRQRQNASSMSLRSAKSNAIKHDIEWTQLTTQIEQAFESLYTTTKSSIHLRLADSKGIALDQLDNVIREHLDRMSKIRQFALEQYEGVRDLMMGELRWVNRLREDKMEEYFMKEYESVHTRWASRDDMMEGSSSAAGNFGLDRGEKFARKTYTIQSQPQHEDSRKAGQTMFEPATRSPPVQHAPHSSYTLVQPDNQVGFVDPETDKRWKAQIQSQIASDLASEYENARNELDSVLESSGMFDPASADIVANDCLEHLDDIKRRAKRRYEDAIEDERLRRLCFAAKIVEPRLVERFISQSREVLYKLKEPFNEDDDCHPIASTSKRVF